MLALPLLAAIAASIAKTSAECTDTFQCHIYCGGLARLARTCGPDGESYDGPFDHACLCDEGTEFQELLPDCLECGWSLWADYSVFITGALAECGAPLEPTSPNCNLEDVPAETTAAPETTTAAETTAEATTAAAPTTTAEAETAAPETTAAAETTAEAAAETTAEAAAPTEAAAETTTAAAAETTAEAAAPTVEAQTTAAATTTPAAVSTFQGAAAKLTLGSGLIAAACALLI